MAAAVTRTGRLTRAEVRQARRRAEFTTRLRQATTVRARARVVGDFIAASATDRSLSESEACAVLDELAAPVLELIRDPEEAAHDHAR